MEEITGKREKLAILSRFQKSLAKFRGGLISEPCANFYMVAEQVNKNVQHLVNRSNLEDCDYLSDVVLVVGSIFYLCRDDLMGEERDAPTLRLKALVTKLGECILRVPDCLCAYLFVFLLQFVVSAGVHRYFRNISSNIVCCVFRWYPPKW